jgi:predicted RNase H-like nuclease
MLLAGIDLAWKSNKNTTAAAFGYLQGTHLDITRIYPALSSMQEVKNVIQSHETVRGIAIDAPLIINNKSGQRCCEQQLGKDYGARGASCHSSNLTKYPEPGSVELSQFLKDHGYSHLRNKAKGKFQIECYPHPAIIEIFGLYKRLPYKKGNVSEKKLGQMKLAEHINGLGNSGVLSLTITDKCNHCLEEQYIMSLAGNAIKTNEDVLDSIICLYTAALFTVSVAHTTYGSIEDGYIYVPKQICNLY